MANAAADLFNNTIGKVEKIRISEKADESKSIIILLRNGADAISIIQGNCLKLTLNKEVFLNCGIATLLHEAKIDLVNEMITAGNMNIITIPINKDLDLFACNKAKIYMVAAGRILGRTFDLN